MALSFFSLLLCLSVVVVVTVVVVVVVVVVAVVGLPRARSRAYVANQRTTLLQDAATDLQMPHKISNCSVCVCVGVWVCVCVVCVVCVPLFLLPCFPVFCCLCASFTVGSRVCLFLSLSVSLFLLSDQQGFHGCVASICALLLGPDLPAGGHARPTATQLLASVSLFSLSLSLALSLALSLSVCVISISVLSWT
jgi:hypothetical protein